MPIRFARSTWLLATLTLLAGPSLSLAEETAPAIAPTHADVRYGEYDRNVLDFYQADTAEPAPLLLFIHGGAWMVGDKVPLDVRPFLNAGISVASVNYRFISGTPDSAPFPAPMQDCARALQFVRSNAQDWNIDPDRVALSGVSAGAVNSMWIAYKADMADPDSEDPIERISTRVTCLVPIAGPTTLDPELVVKRVGGPPDVHPCLLPFYDVKSLDELKLPEKKKLVEDASVMTLVSSDDPPTFLSYPTPLGDTPLPEKTSVMYSIHHAEFGAMIKEKLDEAGVENTLQTFNDGTSKEASLEFLKEHLKPAPPRSQK